jgi:methylenetetrahydrofolate dehydrogenase (NADP+)/methenyltetrahydrofolate cyclohydrolase
MQLLDGKLVAAQIKLEIKATVDELIASGKRAPHSVAVIVGSNPASQTYVASKARNSEAVGIRSTVMELPETTTEEALLELIHQLNNDDSVDGFIVQLPLPSHINESKIIFAIQPEKDVDGFHPVNIGKMVLGDDSAFIPATPMGIVELLKRYHIQTKGLNAVIVGRSNIVGTPIGILLSRNAPFGNCTVTIAHSATTNLKELCCSADILVAAIGRKNFITANMVKPGAIIIDVGINRENNKIYGDVDFDNVAKIASYITPVPGGVGLMTIVSLLQNTLKSYLLKHT